METVWWPGSECDVFGHLLLLIAFPNEIGQAPHRDLLCFCALNPSLGACQPQRSTCCSRGRACRCGRCSWSMLRHGEPVEDSGRGGRTCGGRVCGGGRWPPPRWPTGGRCLLPGGRGPWPPSPLPAGGRG